MGTIYVREEGLRLKFKIWIETDDGKPVIGKGGYALLTLVKQKGSIAEAAREMGISYKFAWEYVKKVSKVIGGVELRKGGKGAGGTELGERVLRVLEVYEKASREIEEVLEKYNRELEEVLRDSTQG